jgi:hypothetical protein
VVRWLTICLTVGCWSEYQYFDEAKRRIENELFAEQIAQIDGSLIYELKLK